MKFTKMKTQIIQFWDWNVVHNRANITHNMSVKISFSKDQYCIKPTWNTVPKHLHFTICRIASRRSGVEILYSWKENGWALRNHTHQRFNWLPHAHHWPVPIAKGMLSVLYNRNLIIALALLLNQLEPPRTLETHRPTTAGVDVVQDAALLLQILLDVPTHEGLRSHLPLLQHLLGVVDLGN